MTNNTIDGISPDSNPDLSPQMDGISHCSTCAIQMCSREKVINLAMGRIEVMCCLFCLGKRENVSAELLLAKIKHYILSRQCFQKEWIKYKDVSVCSHPEDCLSHKYDS